MMKAAKLFTMPAFTEVVEEIKNEDHVTHDWLINQEDKEFTVTENVVVYHIIVVFQRYVLFVRCIAFLMLFVS